MDGYVAAGRWDDGEVMLRRYLALPTARWPQQRAAAWRRLARCRNAKEHTADAMECLHEGLRIAPEMRDLWLDLADIYGAQEEWLASYEASRRGLALPIGPAAIANDPMHAGGRPFYRASLAAWRLGRLQDAMTLAAQANGREPNHPVYRQHLLEVASERD